MGENLVINIDDSQIKSKFKKNLDNPFWYHATTAQYLDSLENGIDVMYNMGNALDFGPGFYLTPDLDKAKDYINKIRKFSNPDSKYISTDVNDKPIVLKYKIDNLRDIFNSDNYVCTLYPKYDERFAGFILKNRQNTGPKIHNYDFIFGVQSDSNPTEVLNSLEKKLITKEEAIQKLRKSTSAKQLYISNQEFCDNLKIIKVIPC